MSGLFYFIIGVATGVGATFAGYALMLIITDAREETDDDVRP